MTADRRAPALPLPQDDDGSPTPDFLSQHDRLMKWPECAYPVFPKEEDNDDR